MYILGISAFFHDSAACLLKSGKIVAAAQEERFSRIKGDAAFPVNAIAYCVKEAGIDGAKIEKVVFFEKPFLKFERLLETYFAVAPSGFSSFVTAMPIWIKEKLFQKRILANELSKLLGADVQWSNRLIFSEHHLSHAASAFFPSPFEEAAILTLDGVGEWATTSLAIGRSNQINVLKEIYFPHSLGLLYSAFTSFLGFKVNSGEYKMMGLAPYGSPIYKELIYDNLVKVAEDGSFHLDMNYFGYLSGLKMTSRKFHKLFDLKPRKPEGPITKKHMDIAASIQEVTEEIIIKLARDIAKNTGQRNLCLAGGVALNCVANGVLQAENLFENIWIQPAAGDAGGSLGAALAAWHIYYNKPRKVNWRDDAMGGAYLGPQYSNEQIEDALEECGGRYTFLDDKALIDRTVRELTAGKAIGWMQGRMEFGPRALGARSIIADPRSPLMQKQLNLKVKFRESFRPFAPSILYERVHDWFDVPDKSPYMLMVSYLLKNKRLKLEQDQNNVTGLAQLDTIRSEVPAITHVNYSARVQTVHRETNYLFHELLRTFEAETGCPMLVNTSFNVRGEPIVNSPSDAFRCFMGTDLDFLCVGNYFLAKEDQPLELKDKFGVRYELD